MNSMKRQKDWAMRDELPRSVGTQYATGDQMRLDEKYLQKEVDIKLHDAVPALKKKEEEDEEREE